MLHQNASADALGFARFIVYGTWLATILMHPTQYFGEVPPEWFVPQGLMRFLPGELYLFLLHPPIPMVLRVSTLVLCALLMLGVRPFRALALICAVMLVLNDSFDKGFNGFVNHAQMGLLYAAWVLPFFPATDGFSVLAPRKKGSVPRLYSAGLSTIALCLATAYAMLGIRRLVYGGVEIFTGDAVLAYFATRSLAYSKYGFEYGLLPLSHPMLASLVKAGFFLVTLAEVATPFALFYRKIRWVWLAIIVPFHVLTVLTMNILFWENLVLVLVFFTAFPHFISTRLSPFHPPETRKPPAM